MKYADFEKIMSPQRMERYLTACGGDTRKAMTLYQVTGEVYTFGKRAGDHYLEDSDFLLNLAKNFRYDRGDKISDRYPDI